MSCLPSPTSALQSENPTVRELALWVSPVTANVPRRDNADRPGF